MHNKYAPNKTWIDWIIEASLDQWRAWISISISRNIRELPNGSMNMVRRGKRNDRVGSRIASVHHTENPRYLHRVDGYTRKFTALETHFLPRIVRFPEESRTRERKKGTRKWRGGIFRRTSPRRDENMERSLKLFTRFNTRQHQARKE